MPAPWVVACEYVDEPKTKNQRATVRRHTNFIHFDTMLACDGRTDSDTIGNTALSIAMPSKIGSQPLRRNAYTCSSYGCVGFMV